MTEWESTTGWHCNNVNDLGGISGEWWVVARLLDLSPADYIKWLIENYKPDYMYFDHDKENFFFHWDKSNYSKAHAFVLYINSVARKKNFII